MHKTNSMGRLGCTKRQMEKGCGLFKLVDPLPSLSSMTATLAITAPCFPACCLLFFALLCFYSLGPLSSSFPGFLLVYTDFAHTASLIGAFGAISPILRPSRASVALFLRVPHEVGSCSQTGIQLRRLFSLVGTRTFLHFFPLFDAHAKKKKRKLK